MVDYAKIRARARAGLLKGGTTATLLVPTYTGPAYKKVEGQPQRHGVVILIDAYANSEIDGTRIAATDKKVWMAAEGLSVTPEPGHRLEFDGAQHAIVNVKPLAPGGVAVMYEVQARR